MRVWRKFTAVALVFVMALAMSATALATPIALGGDSGTGTPGIVTDTTDWSAQDNTITIMKELKVYNTTGSNIYLPTVGYTYTITGETVSDGTKVTDSGSHEGYVYTGDVSALSGTYSVAFSSATTSGYSNDGTATAVTITQPTVAATTGTSYYGGFQITVAPDALGHAGIFRYKIVEAEDATNTLSKAGVVHQDNAYVATRYLDVYVRRAVTADNVSTSFVVYGYVLWYPGNDQTEDTNISVTDGTASVAKTNGFVGAQGGDEYNTWNLTVSKAITGNLADLTHQFPFRVVFTSPNATAATIHYTATNGIPASATTATLSSTADTTIGSLDASNTTLKLSNSGSVTFYGIPAGVTATVGEFNDTYDVYTATATIIANTEQTYTQNEVQSGASATIISGLDNATTTNAVGSADTSTAWSNEMTVISPTGVTLRFAPYFAMLGAGIVALPLSIRRKREDF